MKNIVLFDAEPTRDNLLPLTYTRPIAHLRVGITTLAEKWEAALGSDAEYSYLTPDYLRTKFPMHDAGDNWFVASHFVADARLGEAVNALGEGEALLHGDELIAFRGSTNDFENKNYSATKNYEQPSLAVKMLYDIFMLNDQVLLADFLRLTHNRKPAPLSVTNKIIGDPFFADGTPKIFIEDGVKVEGAILNVTNGPIYLGKEVEVMEGSCIRAPFAACEHAQVNMGSKIYGATTLGPYCKVGGELNNVVMIGYSNKAHDGFLGNAVIGEWCNIGAGTTASNLKNDYTEIKLWNYPTKRFLKTGLQFCGLMMGDHSKAGINCMFNTATVLGVGVNVYGAGFPRNFVASFSEGSHAGFNDVQLTKFFATAERMMARRHKELTETDKEIFTAIYNIADTLK